MRRVALVAGGMGGLGEAICIKLCTLGYDVVTTRSPERYNNDEWLINKKDDCSTYRAYPCDGSDPSSAQQCVALIEKKVGTIAVLINNAVVSSDSTFMAMEKLDRYAVMKAKLESVFNLTKPVCDGMVKRGWGRIVNITSDDRQKGAFEQTHYSAANAERADIYGFSRTLALEVGANAVTVNTISHADIAAKMVAEIPRELSRSILSLSHKGRLGKGEEIAGLVAYLASDEAAFLTGANITFNGG